MNAPLSGLQDLKRHSVRGGLLITGAQAATAVIQLISTIALARILGPTDYGILAMATAVTAFAMLFRDLGLSAAAIQKTTLNYSQQNSLFWINIGFALILTMAVSALAPLVARFYGVPSVAWVTAALSLLILISSISSQSSAQLSREMGFGRIAFANVAGASSALVFAIASAIQGLGYWSLVLGQLCGAVVTTLLLFRLSSFRPSSPTITSEIRPLLKFGVGIVGYDFSNYFSRNLDNVLIGKFYGSDVLGLYSRAYSLLMLPITYLRGPLNTVGFPAMSRMADHPQEFRRYYRNVTSLLAFLTMPLAAGLFTFAETLIPFALGEHWRAVVPIFSVLSFVSLVQPAITMWGVVAMSRGLTKRYFYLGVANSAVTVVGFGLGVKWGAIGVALSYVFTTYLLAMPTLFLAFRGTPLSILDFFESIVMPLTGSLSASIVVWAGANFTFGLPLNAPSVFLVPLFVLVYLLVVASSVSGRKLISHLIEMAKAATKKVN